MPIRWPVEFEPAGSPVFVSNEMEIAAPAETVWAWLIRAESWPGWYPNSRNVRILEGSRPDLALGTRFRWWTFGVRIESVVREFEPCERLAWDAHAPGIRAYHAWVFTRTPAGCHVLTEETQHGFVARLGKFFMPHRMHRGHQLWLERLALKAREGLPSGGKP
ncbi:MAG TPA: SRPBCC domain-containing protein [Candidatus Acidoferrales bacterium]|nr:SRPBCC domain-containing protein [Candidatus Acidoferrales bacterium]